MQKKTKIIRFAMLQNPMGVSVSGMEKVPTDCLEWDYHDNWQGSQKVGK